MDSYFYDNITGSDHIIRLLALSPGREENPLYGTLETCRLDGAVEYEALSYCWGPTRLESNIHCSRGSIPITKTLERALRVLRHDHKTRRLWIDQICINQQDNAERSSQVRLMYEIYSLAQRTIVWLGEDEGEHGPVVEKLFRDFQAMGADYRKPAFIINSSGEATMLNPVHSLDEQIRIEEEEIRMEVEEDQKITANKKTPWFPEDDVLDQCRLPLRSSKAWPAFNELLRSRYFTRAWTLQEVLSSREAVIIWGATELTWASLRVAYRWVMLNRCHIKDTRPISESPELETVPFLNIEFDWFRGRRCSDLAGLVAICRDALQATDPRDQIYAFISLASDGKDFNIDYRKRKEDVFRDFAKHCILQCGDLTMLNFAGLYRDEGPRLPSWVPSWSSRSIFGKTPSHNDSLRAAVTSGEPMFPLAGEVRSKIFMRHYHWRSEASLAERPDQLFIKGYRLPKDQAKMVCTHQAFLMEDTTFVSIEASYKELCQLCESPSTILREMVKCLVSAETEERIDDHGLSAHFISFIFNCILLNLKRFEKTLDRFVPSLEMIRIASDAMESGVIATDSAFSTLSSTQQEYIKNVIREAYSNRLSQEGLDKVLKAISDNWKSERAFAFDHSFGLTGLGRKLFLTNQGRVGIGPACMTTTDMIIIAYGGETPYVLRSVPDTQEYLLLGDCYIHDLMDGTAEPKDDDPPAEWFCLGGEPRQTMDTTVASSGAQEAGSID